MKKDERFVLPAQRLTLLSENKDMGLAVHPNPNKMNGVLFHALKISIDRNDLS